MKNAKAYIDGMGDRSEVEQQLAEQTSQNHAVAVGVKQPLSTMRRLGNFWHLKMVPG